MSILSGILSGRAEQVTKCQFLIKATLSEATSPFNAQLNDGNPSGQSAYHGLLCQPACTDPSAAQGDSPGAADSAEDRYTQKERFNFQLRSPRASNHSPDNPMCLITMATHLPPDIALSVSDTHTQVRIYRSAYCCLNCSVAKNVARTVHLFGPNCPINEAKETSAHGGDKESSPEGESTIRERLVCSVVASFKSCEAWQAGWRSGILSQQVSLYPSSSLCHTTQSSWEPLYWRTLMATLHHDLNVCIKYL